jgi:Chemotaxis response regulator containing a CheY-like receiver domain and a methylesterase domain
MERIAKTVRVLIVDDSASVRRILTDILHDPPEIEVMGSAADPFAAARRIQQEIPDVIILDIEMPRMDGLTFLRKIMEQRPIPVIICSSHAEPGSETLLQALDAGAFDIIKKPCADSRSHLMEARERFRAAVLTAAGARLRRVSRSARHAGDTTGHVSGYTVEPKLTADVMLPPPASSARGGASLATAAPGHTAEAIVCIGASTGGTESLRAVLTALPADSPGIVVVQHMPEKFTAAFARRLDGLCRVSVKEAETGDPVLPGQVLIAPGGRHTLLQRKGSHYQVAVKDGPPVARHRPSVDVLFRSAARTAGGNAVGILMTGMGDDGARGLLEMRNAGAFTVAQDEETSIVFGMPKEAIDLGAAIKVVPLDLIPVQILRARP